MHLTKKDQELFERYDEDRTQLAQERDKFEEMRRHELHLLDKSRSDATQQQLDIDRKYEELDSDRENLALAALQLNRDRDAQPTPTDLCTICAVAGRRAVMVPCGHRVSI